MELKKILNELTNKIKPLLMEGEESVTVQESEENKEKGITQTSSKKYTSKDLIAAIFNGMGIGLLLGILLGLAVSPVVSAFIGTLSSVLVLLLGLNEKYFSVVKSMRIGSFGLFAVAGILLGFYIRSHSPLAPSLSELKEEYIALGYDDTVAKEILLFQEFNVIPKDWMGRMVVKQSKPDTSGSDSQGETVSQQMMAHNVNVSKRNNVLFSSSVNIGDCYQLESSNEDMSFEVVSFNFTGIGGSWKELAEKIDPELPDEVKTKTLLIVRDVICSSNEKKTITIKCNEFNTPPEQNSAEELKNLLGSSDKFWKQVSEELDAHVDQTYHKKIYLSLINAFCHEE